MTDLVLVISSLGPGGAERVLCELANYWDAKGCRVTLVTIDSAGHDFYELSPGIARVGLGLLAPSRTIASRLANNIVRVWKLRAVFRDFPSAIIVSFGDVTNVTTLVAAGGLRRGVVISERSNPWRHPISPVWGLMRSLVYRWASALVIPVSAYASWAMELLPRSRVYVIPNAVRFCKSILPGSTSIEGRRVLAVGRLGTEKGFDMLLQAFAVAIVGRGNWSLTVVGDGPQRSVLEALADELGLSGKVSFPGSVRDIEHYYQQSDIFVLSSRYEGFPNVLLEAMAMGIAVISFDCVSGPSELIEDGVNGVLVPSGSIDALARAISDLMDSTDKRRMLGRRAREMAVQFSPATVFPIWDKLLDSVSRDNVR